MSTKVFQKLYLGRLPEGLVMSITDVKVKVSVPEGTRKSKDWRVGFSTHTFGGSSGVRIDENGFLDELSPIYPLGMSTSNETESQKYSGLYATSDLIFDGLIGTVWFESQNPRTSRGPGGKVDITIRIEGTTNRVLGTSEGHGKSQAVEEKGYISVSTSNWKLNARPDEVHINYSFTNTPPASVSLSVPSDGMTDDLHFLFDMSADGKKIVASTSPR